ncbi:hypothetical protein F4703DRAFT_1881254 [Phycomyces blakesleeanus]
MTEADTTQPPPAVIDQTQKHQDAEEPTNDNTDPSHPSLLLATDARQRGLTTGEPASLVPPISSSPIPTSGHGSFSANDLERMNANAIFIKNELKAAGPTNLTLEEQEKQDKPVIEGLQLLLDNRFMSAKAAFSKKANVDPLHALALSSMAFLKAVMTSAEHDQTTALNALNITYDIAKTQRSFYKTPPAMTGYISRYYNFIGGSEEDTSADNKSQAAQKPKPKPKTSSIPPTSTSETAAEEEEKEEEENEKDKEAPAKDTTTSPTQTVATSEAFPPNGLLRAHVIEAECCLQIAILQLIQGSIIDYVKCGLNLRRAYSSYVFVWEEYTKMGPEHSKYMDANTVSCVQFGVGAVHLVLATLPVKVLKAVSVLGWKPDKQLGFGLLNACAEGNGVRAYMATMMLLSYYTTVTSFTPQILSSVYTKSAMETLLEAQRGHPNSALYLFFSGSVARLAIDLPLSTKSYLYASDMGKGDWAELAFTNTSRYEVALNHLITGNWDHAATAFGYLSKHHYWSAAFCKYAEGACLEMNGKRTEAILTFADVEALVDKKKGSSRMEYMDAYTLRKIATLQESGYQDMGMYCPILEFMFIWNLFHFMDHNLLKECISRVDDALEFIQLKEEQAYQERMIELAPDTDLPDYFDERAILLLIKASIKNVLGQTSDIAGHLNWIIDHRESFGSESWVVPYAFWESGVSCWNLDDKPRARRVWEMALTCSKYDFEYRLSVRLGLALTRAEELGFTTPIPEPESKSRFSLSLSSLIRNKSTTAET